MFVKKQCHLMLIKYTYMLQDVLVKAEYAIYR